MNWAIFANGFWLPPAGALAWQGFYRLFPHMPMRTFFVSDWLGIAIVQAILWSILGLWQAEPGAAANAIVAFIVWWWRRRKRRNVAALIGAKSKAARNALVRKVRESAKPRPVLKPQPQGAR